MVRNSAILVILLFNFEMIGYAQPLVDAPINPTFKQAVDLYQAGKFEQAEPLLQNATQDSGALGIYQQFFLADTLVQLNRPEEAAPILKGILVQKPPNEIKFRVFFMQSQQAIDKGQWRDARTELMPLAKHWKTSPDYPQVLYRLMRTEMKLHSQVRACKWALKLYTHFPTYPLVSEWSYQLKDIDVDGKKMTCQVRVRDFQDRVHRLEWADQVDRARQEINQAKDAVSENDKFHYDLIMARFLVNEGLVEDALALLVRNYPQEKTDFDYLSLLGLAAARAGEYQTAVGAYDKAHALSPRSRQGREALFQAAFLSYQFQDYDGAVKRFNELATLNPRSGLARDAKWYLAWLQYLRDDFEGALKMMADVRSASLRSRRFAGSVSDQRLLYWMAMSHMRMNQFPEARVGFESLIHEDPDSYYALSSQARLMQIPQDTIVVVSAKVPAVSTTAAPAAIPAAASADDDDESEDNITESTPAEPDEPEEKEASSESEPMDSTEFKEPVLRAHLQAANELTALTMPDLARAELQEVERRTANPAYLKLLITAYEAIGSYQRSAYISDLNFSGDRHRQGLDGARGLWLSAFPEAFHDRVAKACTLQKIPNDWVWAIMRAESFYKPTTISPVGAKGLMQLMPFTARNLVRLSSTKPASGELPTPDLMDSTTNINLGAQYLARLGREFQRNLSLMAAAYNAGPHRVQAWLVTFGHLETDEFIEHIPFVETRNYVKKVLLNDYVYRTLYGKDATSFKWLAEPLGVAIPSKIPTHENWDAL